MEQTTRWSRDEYTIYTDKKYLDQEAIFRFLNEEAYWAKGIPREVVAQAIEHTPLCFGMYKGDPAVEPAQLIGFARVITDLTTFAYLADVFVLSSFRGRGLGKWLVHVVTNHPQLQRLRRFMLVTRDAHSLYATYGFKPLAEPSRFMEIARKDVYQTRA